VKDFIEKCQILQAATRIDHDSKQWAFNYELIGVKSNDLLSFRKTMKIRVFDMDHSVPCCGYRFYECRQK
jgi:hypothetical protein